MNRICLIFIFSIFTIQPVFSESGFSMSSTNAPFLEYPIFAENASNLQLSQTDIEKKYIDNQELEENSSFSLAEEKRCMMVCMEWGEDCVNDPKTGRTVCRRVCEKFGEECF